MLGPGLTTGASDDDPSGITTYSQAGAQYGYKMLWTAGLTFPLMAVVQEMCARIGLVTGKGLAAAIRTHYSKKVLYAATVMLLVANTFNIGADLGMMARATQLLTRYGLGQFLHHRPRQLSGGMRQRVALARTLCTEPDIVLLDEPFAALDSQTRLALADEVTEILRRERKTAILVTHDIGEAISMAERVVVLSRRPGRVKSDRPIRFATPDGARPAPFAARNAPEFNGYFNTLWQELEVHVEG